MNVKWTCTACKKIEITGPNVPTLTHVHGGTVYELQSFKKKRKSSDSVSVLKKEAWDVFSIWIRRRAADDNGWTQCVTCGAFSHWKNYQAGHFISRRHNTILFDTRNVHVQCPRCNGMLHGNISKYQEYMIETYGQNVVDELFRLAKLKHQFKVYELKAIIEQYKALLEEMQ